jgi:streptogramin lyase
MYSYALPAGVEPLIVATHGSRLWFVDSRNVVDVFDTKTGEYYAIGKLEGGARISYLAAGSDYVFAIDTTAGQIDVVSSVQERVVQTYPMSALAAVVAVAVGPDDRLWLGLRNAPYLLVFDPKLGRMDSVYLSGARVAALTVDGRGRVVYADDLRGAVGIYEPATNHLYEVAFHKRGTTTALVSDADGTLWFGTTTGEIYAVAGTTVTLSQSLQRPVTSLVTDQRGRAWYLAPLRPGIGGFGFGPADGSQAPRLVPGPAAGLAFNALGWAFLGDPRGAVYIATPADDR